MECVQKKRGMIVAENDQNELIPLRPIIRWCVCIDYRKLNSSTLIDHFLMSFMDEILNRLVGRGWYWFLDGYLL